MKTLDHSLTCDEILLDEVNEGRRSSLPFHGTFLLGQALRFPSSVPAYRDGRSHEAFCRNLPLAAGPIRAALSQAWQTDGQAEAPDTNAIDHLASRKYANPEWTHRRP